MLLYFSAFQESRTLAIAAMVSPSPEGASSNFPQDPSEFDSDPRISFSKLDDKFILETDDGQEFEYDTALKRWIPTVCARFLSSW